MSTRRLARFFADIGRQHAAAAAASPCASTVAPASLPRRAGTHGFAPRLGRVVLPRTSTTTSLSVRHASSSSSVAAAAAAPSTSRLVSPAPRATRRKQRVSYPYSSSAIASSLPTSFPPSIPAPPQVKSRERGVMPTLLAHLRAQYDDKAGSRTALFSRRPSSASAAPSAVPVGSVLIVETWTGPTKTNATTFSGVLIGVRRRGTSTSFVLRNIVNKLGTEVRFNLYSPLLKDIRVVQRAEATKADRTGALRRARRAKLYYLRDDDRKIAAIGRQIQQARAKEARLAQEATKRAGSRAAGGRPQQRG